MKKDRWATLSRLSRWLDSKIFTRRKFSPIDDPEIAEYAHRVHRLEHVTEKQSGRLSQVEIRVGVRSGSHWNKVDQAG